MNRDEIVKVVRTYLYGGVLNKDPDGILLSDDCVRMENGVKTGTSGVHIKEMFHKDNYKANEAIENERWVVEGDHANVWYDLVLTGIDFPIRVAALFKVADGLIKHIDVMVDAGPIHEGFMASLKALEESI